MLIIELDGKQVTQHDGHADGDHGDAGRHHARADTFDDHGSRACQSGLRDFLRGLIAVRGVVFRSLTDDDTGSQTRDDRERQPLPVLDVKQVENDKGGNGDKYG